MRPAGTLGDALTGAQWNLLMETTRHVAVDLGASGGRVAVGSIADGVLSTQIVHRFENFGTWLPSGLYWDPIYLWREVMNGLRLAAHSGPLHTVGVNSWGVDYALLDENGLLVDGVHHYRDPRTEGMMRRAFDRVGREEIYRRTGIQFMSLNTLYQLLAHEYAAPGVLRRAKRLLFVPDLIHRFLCGSEASETTIASTSQLMDARTRSWDRELIEALGIPDHLFGEIVEPGAFLGDVHPAIGVTGAKVVAPAAHDTASAVAAVPALAEGAWAYVSIGTWALAGIEVANPLIDDSTLGLNLTNEAGVGGTTRVLKNITGLWILQECRRAWGDPSYEALYAEAESATGDWLIDPDAQGFQQPTDAMPSIVQAYCAEHGPTRPETRGEIVRCILTSLAVRIREVIGQLEEVGGMPISTVHVVGGGSQIRLLNQLVADGIGREVVAGPTDATLIGNLLVQAEAFGSIEKGSVRQVVHRSERPTTYHPQT